MGLELYLDLLSQPSQPSCAVYIFVKKNDIPLELRTVELFKALDRKETQQLESEGAQLMAEKKGDQRGVAIPIYLSANYQTADHRYPADLQAHAHIREYLGWHADCIRGTFSVPLWVQVLAPLIGVQVPKEKVECNRTTIDKELQLLEDKFLRDKPFLTSQQVTLADLMAPEELMQA
uniref:Glutathione S-transferase theta 2B n=1 Tax=Rousettus aegyptiacus TaxID=9407 RepID=A0A7J8GZL7_ROUAE|nr:glutathione S-transferase theta 2B [Rousettus aegyptiacus]